MIHEMKLKPHYFDLIRDGSKIYEVRLYDEKRRTIKVGDEIVFKREPELIESVKTTVTEILLFDNFLSLASTIPANLLGFSGLESGEIEKIYHEFYSVSDEIRYGVVAFRLEVK